MVAYASFVCYLIGIGWSEPAKLFVGQTREENIFSEVNMCARVATVDFGNVNRILRGDIYK